MCTCWLRILDWKVDWWYFRLISKNNHNDFRYFFGRIHRWSIDLNRTPVSVEVINPWISSPSHHHFNYVSASHRGSGLSLPIWNTLFIFCFLCDWLLGHGLNWFLFLVSISIDSRDRIIIIMKYLETRLWCIRSVTLRKLFISWYFSIPACYSQSRTNTHQTIDYVLLR